MLRKFGVFESKKLAIQQFVNTKKVTEEEFERFLQFEERYYKYLPWMLKVWCQTDKKLDPDEIYGTVQWFDTNLPRLDVKDINRYTYEDLLKKEQELGASKNQQEKEAKILDSQIVYEDDQFKIMLIKTYKAANMYNGHNPSTNSRSWCVGRQENTWDSYTEHSTFYFAWYEPKGTKWENFKRAAIQVQGNKITVWDHFDSSHSLKDTPFAHLEKYFKYITPDLRERLLKLTHEVLPDKTYHFKVSLNLRGKGLKSLRELPIRIKIVDGEFDISENELIDLKGCPEKVGSLNASGNSLKSLEGSPKHVKESFKISKNPLSNLKGAPEYIGGNFEAQNCELISLVGGPKEVKGEYNVSNNKLKNSFGLAEKVGKSINFDHNQFETLDVEAEELRKIVSIKKNPLKDYTGFTPELFAKTGRVVYEKTEQGLVFKSTFSFNDDYLIDSLELLPFKIYKVEKDFHFVRRKLLGLKVKNLKGSPEIVDGTVDISSNNLESLEGSPRIVNGKFMASFNNLKDLKGFPDVVGNSVMLNMNAHLSSLEGIGQLKKVPKSDVPESEWTAKIFMLGCPVRDLSPLKNNEVPVEIIYSEASPSDFINVPSHVKLTRSEDV